VRARSRAVVLAALAVVLAAAAPLFSPERNAADAAATPLARNVVVVGRSNLGGEGLNGDVAVSGNVALVGAGLVPHSGYHTERYEPVGCHEVTAKVVDISTPSSPRVVATIEIPKGAAAIDVDLLQTETRLLGAIAIDDGASHGIETGCPAADSPAFVDRGVALYDLAAPASPRLLGRYAADADAVPADAPPCGPGQPGRCATGQHSVDLFERGGQVIMLTTEPAAHAFERPSSDVRLVDVTDPTKPAQLSSFPPLAERLAPFSPNGCAPYTNAHAGELYLGGVRALVASMDGGLLTLDVGNLASPRLFERLSYPGDRAVEGNAAYVTSTRVGDFRLALLSEEDFLPAETTLQVSAPASLAGDKPACEGMPTLFDPLGAAQLFRRPGERIGGELVYVGRGCLAGSEPADSYLRSPAERIALVDAARVSETQPGLPTAGVDCRLDARVRRAQAAGAVAVVVGRVSSSPPEAWSGSASGIGIPTAMIGRTDMEALRSALCPAVAGGACVGGQTGTAFLRAQQGRWGAFRVMDVTSPRAIRFIAEHRTATAFPPPGVGVHAPGHAVADGNGYAYVAWNADGVRIFDLSNGGRPSEVGFFVPADAADPTATLPAVAHVTGVAYTGRHLVVTDANSGLYVLSYRPSLGTPGNDLLRGTVGPDRISGLAGNDRIRGFDAADTLTGGPGNDDLAGGGGADRILAGDGNDVVGGDRGNDRLEGGTGNDRLDGGPQNDMLVGGLGRNSYLAGPGNDVVEAANGVRETVNCGSGRDRAVADRRDLVRQCERVVRRRR
jgi:hypothetical protein